MVYESGGITLNWQLPPGQNSGEPQMIRYAYHCDRCGRRGAPRGRAVQRNVRLGGEPETDVYELQLNDSVTGAPLSDLTTAMTLAVALREAVARRLGVEAREIGWSATIDKSEVASGRATIILYDTAGGGAGYVG